MIPHRVLGMVFSGAAVEEEVEAWALAVRPRGRSASSSSSESVPSGFACQVKTAPSRETV